MLAGLLLLFSSVLLVAARAHLYEQLDRHLHRDAEAARQALHGPAAALAWRDIPHPPDDAFDTDPFVEVWTLAGRRLFQRGPLGVAAAPSALPAPEPGYRTHQGLRLAVEPLALPGIGELQLRVVRSESELRAQLRRWALALAALTLLCSALALALSTWLTRGALRPLKAIVEQVRQLRLDQPGQRIDGRGQPMETAALVDSYNAMLERIEASYRQVDRFAADVAHELRTPLTALRLRGEQQLQDLPAGAARAAVGEMLEATDRMLVLINRLLVLARAESQRDATRLQLVDVAALARDAVERLQPLIDQRECRVLVPAAVTTALADPQWLLQVFTDLLHNAIKAAPSGSLIWVESDAVDERSVVIAICDQGPGIARAVPVALGLEAGGPEGQAGHPPPIQGEGSGLGLQIASRLLVLQGGTLAFAPAQPRGTRALVTLQRS